MMFGIFTRKKRINRKWVTLAIIAYVAMLLVNGLAGSTTLLGGVSTAEVSDAYPNLFAPAGFTFAIWAVIYLLLGMYILRLVGIIGSKSSALSIDDQNHVIKLFAYSSLLNILWIFAWQYKMLWLSVLIMLGLLAVLILINRITRTGSYAIKDYMTIRLPFSVYFGWICVATIANITTWLVSIGWNRWGLSEVTWMIVALILGAAVGMINAYRNQDPAFLAVFVWAYTGILAKHMSDSGFDGKYPSIIVLLAILIAVIMSSVMNLMQFSQRRV